MPRFIYRIRFSVVGLFEDFGFVVVLIFLTKVCVSWNFCNCVVVIGRARVEVFI